MDYNSFFSSILIRILLLLLTITGIAYLFVMNNRFFTLLFLMLLAILQTILLFAYLNRTNRNLARFLLLLTQEDTSVVLWKDRVERTFQGLHHSFEKVNIEISRIRLEKETGTILLQRTIDHISTGILAVEDTGRIEIVNEAALKLFGMAGLHHMDDLDQFQEGISVIFSDLRYDSGNIIHYHKDGMEETPLLIRTSLLKLEDRTLRLYSIQNIKTELEANEIESWQKMTRVLSHEISNSVTPISTLGAGIHRKLSQGQPDKDGRLVLSSATATDLLRSSELIEQRGNALVEFMEHYKTFARLPDPVPGRVQVDSFFNNLGLLFRDDLKMSGIRFESEPAKSSLCILADLKLLEQAFINLIRNAADVLKEREGGIISLKAIRQDNHTVVLEVSDNGPGIPPEIQSQVFIPFFTTKQGGTGIGLSIVRKVVLMSGGTIIFHSTPDRGTKFVVKMPEC